MKWTTWVSHQELSFTEWKWKQRNIVLECAINVNNSYLLTSLFPTSGSNWCNLGGVTLNPHCEVGLEPEQAMRDMTNSAWVKARHIACLVVEEMTDRGAWKFKWNNSWGHVGWRTAAANIGMSFRWTRKHLVNTLSVEGKWRQLPGKQTYKSS